MASKAWEEFKEELKREMKEFKSKIERDLRHELREMKDSLDFVNKEYEDAKSKNEQLERENEALKEANKTLLDESNKAKKQLEEHEIRITASEQYSRNRNVEIKGVKKEDSEDLMKIVSLIGNALEEQVTPDDIEVCHRTKTRNESSHNIVVQFKTRSKRDSLLLKARKTRLSMKNLDENNEESPIYVNEHLCPVMKKLLGITVARKKECKWKFVWTRDGRIFARRDETSNVINVRSERDIQLIV